MRAGPDRRAMDGEESGGRAPVVIVRPTTNVTSGVAVTQKLVRAAVAFGDLIRGTYGPNGLDKMLYKSNGETAVTNDGARIVADLLVKHPAAKTSCQWRKPRKTPAAMASRGASSSRGN